MIPWTVARQAALSITNSQSSLKLMSIESVMPSSHLILCHPLFLLPAISPSIRVFSNESTLHTRWPKYRSFSFSIILSKEHPGLISFRIDWLHLLVDKFRLKLNKVEKTTRPFSYDLNQVPYDYTVEVRNRFKGLDLIECLMNYGWRFMTLYRRQGPRPSPKKRNAKKQNGCLRRPYK